MSPLEGDIIKVFIPVRAPSKEGAERALITRIYGLRVRRSVPCKARQIDKSHFYGGVLPTPVASCPQAWGLSLEKKKQQRGSAREANRDADCRETVAFLLEYLWF